MRKLLTLAVCAAAVFPFCGCSNSTADEAPPKEPTTVNNKAPEAATAGAAPAITDTPTPGQGLGKKRSTPGSPAAPPP